MKLLVCREIIGVDLKSIREHISPPPYSSRQSPPPQRSERDYESYNYSGNRRSNKYNGADGRDRRHNNNQRRNGPSDRSTYHHTGTPPQHLVGTVVHGKMQNSYSMNVRNYVNSILTNILVDSASAISVINKAFFDVINDLYPVKLKQHDSKTHYTTKDSIHVTALAGVPLQFCNKDKKESV